MTYHELFSKLKFVTRFSGMNMIQPERLESHILEMAGLAFDLFYDIGGFDLKKALYLILIHDIDEAVTVDVPRPFKYHSEEFRQALSKNTVDYLTSLGIDKMFLHEALNAKKSGREGKIVNLLDLLQVWCKLQTEISLGNSTLGEQVDNVRGYFKKLEDDPELYPYMEYVKFKYLE
jgi:5'-deoxynucleotidase YfbR-like HD superfamily hydrolase